MPDPTPLLTTGVASGGRVGGNLQRSDQGTVPDLSSAVAALQRAGSQPWLFLPKGWRDGWDQALSNVWQAPAWMTAWGDSFTLGVQTTDWPNKAWFGLLRAAYVAQGLPQYGDFDPSVDCQDFLTFGGGATYQGT